MSYQYSILLSVTGDITTLQSVQANTTDVACSFSVHGAPVTRVTRHQVYSTIKGEKDGRHTFAFLCQGSTNPASALHPDSQVNILRNLYDPFPIFLMEVKQEKLPRHSLHYIY